MKKLFLLILMVLVKTTTTHETVREIHHRMENLLLEMPYKGLLTFELMNYLYACSHNSLQSCQQLETQAQAAQTYWQEDLARGSEELNQVLHMFVKQTLHEDAIPSFNTIAQETKKGPQKMAADSTQFYLYAQQLHQLIKEQNTMH